MGNLCSSCFGGSSESTHILTPNPEDRRREMAEAAERRIQEQERKVNKNIKTDFHCLLMTLSQFCRELRIQKV